MGLFGLGREKPRRQPTTDEEKRARLELEFKAEDLEMKRLKRQAIQRAVSEAPDALDAVEVITVATHNGKGPLPIIPRRKTEVSKLQELMEQKLAADLLADPTERMLRMIDQERELRAAARDAAGGDDDDDGDGSGMGQLIGAIPALLGLMRQGQQAPQQPAAPAYQAPYQPPAPAPLETPMQAPALHSGPAGSPLEPAPPSLLSSPGSGTASPSEPDQPGAIPPAPPPFDEPLPPAGLRTQVQLGMLDRASPDQAARWLLGQAETQEDLSWIVDGLIGTPADQLADYLAQLDAALASDPDRGDLRHVIRRLCQPDRWAWTLAVHDRLRALGFADQEPEPADEAAG